MPETRIEKFVFYFDSIEIGKLKFKFFSSNGTATTSFAPTPLCPTYLVAFVVSDLPFRTNNNNPSGFRYRVYAQPALIESTALAVRDGERLLNALADYVQVNFSLPKMDQIAIPGWPPGGKLCRYHLFKSAGK